MYAYLHDCWRKQEKKLSTVLLVFSFVGIGSVFTARIIKCFNIIVDWESVGLTVATTFRAKRLKKLVYADRVMDMLITTYWSLVCNIPGSLVA